MTGPSGGRAGVQTRRVTHTDGAFALDGLPALSRATVDRDEPLRDDVERRLALWPDARVLRVDEQGRFPVDGDELVFTPAAGMGAEPPAGAVLLGEQDGVAYWAVATAVPAEEPADDWSDLRRSGGDLAATSAGLAVTAVAVLGWHRRAPFCPRCGTASDMIRAGWARLCPSCGLEEYPRTDPAVICLVHDGADHVLVARGPSWPVDRFSVLAGFVEAGESLEACVAREIHEEVGVHVRDIGYLGSQPWPFPRSLMIGFAALADRDAELRCAEGEIAEAKWVSRADVRASLATGAWSNRDGLVAGPAPTGLLLPGPVSIAGAMLRSWAAAG